MSTTYQLSDFADVRPLTIPAAVEAALRCVDHLFVDIERRYVSDALAAGVDVDALDDALLDSHEAYARDRTLLRQRLAVAFRELEASRVAIADART